MSSAWAGKEREKIQTNVLSNTGRAGESPQFQDFCISLLDELLQGRQVKRDSSVTEKIVKQVLESGQSPEDAWYHFFNLAFSAAMSTASDTSHKNLVRLMFALASHDEVQIRANSGHSELKGSSLQAALTSFGWTARGLWNGPQNFVGIYGTQEAAQRAWVNLNRFTAHLSCQQRLTPVETFCVWPEDFGLWTISDGLEYRKGAREYGEPAAVWLIIAGVDICNDLSWGKNDGNEAPKKPVWEGPLWSNRLAVGATPEMRWGFWAVRLLEIASDESLDASARQMAEEAVRVMRSAVSDSDFRN